MTEHRPRPLRQRQGFRPGVILAPRCEWQVSCECGWTGGWQHQLHVAHAELAAHFDAVRTA